MITGLLGTVGGVVDRGHDDFLRWWAGTDRPGRGRVTAGPVGVWRAVSKRWQLMLGPRSRQC